MRLSLLRRDIARRCGGIARALGGGVLVDRISDVDQVRNHPSARWHAVRVRRRVGRGIVTYEEEEEDSPHYRGVTRRLTDIPLSDLPPAPRSPPGDSSD